MDLKRKLGNRIQYLRQKCNLTQSELAEKIGIASKYQSCIETGKNYPSAELIEKYAQEFNVDVSVILDISNVKNSKELLVEITKMINNASETELILIYKILKNILY